MNNIDKFINILFKTKNYNKILPEFNKLTQEQKQVVVLNDKINQRINKIADINFLVNILIDLPIEFRIKFLKQINVEKYSKDYEKIVIEFIKLRDYDEFDYKKFIYFENMKDKQLLLSIFRKLSSNKLKFIIDANYNQFINDFAFIEYSKKNVDLVLEQNLISNVSENILYNELKRRSSNNKLTTLIDIEEFLETDLNRQNHLLINGLFQNLEDKLLQIFLKNLINLSNDNLTKMFESLIQNLTYINLLKIQTIIFSIDDKKAIELIKLVFKNVYKIEDEIEEKYLISMVYNFRKLNHKTKELYKLTKLKPFSIIHYLNTGLIDEKVDKLFNTKITITQYQKTNIKKINKILKILNSINVSDKNTLDKINLTILAYKLYYIFGYENTIELLNGKFGNINLELLGKLLNECDIKNVEFQKINNTYEPIIKHDLIQFLIGEKKDYNTTIKRILRGELDLLIKEFSNLYNNFERFQQNIGKKIHLNKLIPILEKNPFMLLPNEYKLTRDIIDNIIKSYKGNGVVVNDINSKECVIKACNFYHNYLEKRVISSIPRVFGITKDNYQYEVLKLDDPTIMTLGYQTSCCFRLNGLSKEFLRYCSESLYARVVVIKNEQKEICAMVPIIRNGNVIVGNSIEKNSKGSIYKVYEALKCAYDDILKISSQYEEKPIVACCVTDLHSNISELCNNRINGNIFPIRANPFYTNYGSPTYIVSSLKNKTEDDFNLYSPNAIYFDERPNILVYHWSMKDVEIKNDVEKRVKSIAYQHNISEEYLHFANYIICSEDWYLKVSYDGINGNYLEKDPRAIQEFNAVREYLKKQFENKRIYDVQFNEEDIINTCVNHDSNKQFILKKKIGE